MSIEFYWVAVVATTVLSSARITRLLNFDKFPPIKYLRDKYENKTDGTDWVWLTMCGYCMGIWTTALVFGLGLWASVYGDPMSRPDNAWYFLTWWILNGYLAMSYLAGSYVARDGSGADGV